QKEPEASRGCSFTSSFSPVASPGSVNQPPTRGRLNASDRDDVHAPSGCRLPLRYHSASKIARPRDLHAVGKHRLDAAFAEMASATENVAHDQARIEAGATRIDAPAAIERNRAGRDFGPLRGRAVTVGKSRVAAAEISVALARQGMGDAIGDGDRIH